MIFRTQYNEEEFRAVYPKKYEKVNNKKLVETAGYIPAKIRIENLMLAGKRLAEARDLLYDFQEGEEIDENFTDPTRSKNFDMADATQIKHAMQQKVRNDQKESLKKTTNNSQQEPKKTEVTEEPK